jgi:hypothetical protein
MCWNGQGTTIVWNNGEFVWSALLNWHSISQKFIKFGCHFMATLKLGMKYKLEADFTRYQKEGHFTKSFDPHKLRNIHPVLTWTMSSIFLWISWDLSYLNYYLPLCNGQGAMIFLVLNYCHFVKSKKKKNMFCHKLLYWIFLLSIKENFKKLVKNHHNCLLYEKVQKIFNFHFNFLKYTYAWSPLEQHHTIEK